MSEIGLPKSYSTFTFVASFKADPERWSRFKGGCAERGVSICHVLDALMEAWIQGQKATATVVKPVVINLTMEHVVKRPRRILKEPTAWEISQKAKYPPPCEKVDKFLLESKEVGCLLEREWIPLQECWRCYLARQGS